MDSPLTRRGLDQINGYAAALQRALPARCELEICSSPLPRARQTAWLLSELLGVPCERYLESELLAERDCGAWEGLTLAEIEARHGAQAREWWRQWEARLGGDGETLMQVQERARAWLAQPRSCAHVVVVTHGVMSRQFRGAYLGLDPQGTMALETHAQDRIYVLDGKAITARSVES